MNRKLTDLDRYLDRGFVPHDSDEVRTTAVLADVRGVYAVSPPPTPRAELAALFNEDTLADVVGFTPRPGRSGRSMSRTRTRILALAAATVLAVGATTGLAAAQSLPDPLQRVVSGVLAHAGIHVPTPSSPSLPPPPPRSSVIGPNPTTDGGAPSTTPLPSDAAASTTTTSTTTTLPPVPLPPVSLPPVTVPTLPLTLPQLGL